MILNVGYTSVNITMILKDYFLNIKDFRGGYTPGNFP